MAETPVRTADTMSLRAALAAATEASRERELELRAALADREAEVVELSRELAATRKRLASARRRVKALDTRVEELEAVVEAGFAERVRQRVRRTLGSRG